MAQLKVDLVVDDKGKLVITGFGKEVDRVMYSSRAAVADFGRQVAIGGAALTAFVAAGGYAVSQFTKVADTYSLIESRLKLVTDGTEQLNRVQEKLYQSAQDTYQGYEATAGLYTGLARSTKELNISEERLLGITESLNKSMAVSGASQEAQANSMQQLNQAMFGGIVRAEEFNSVMDNTPRVLEAVADGMGVTMGELRQKMLDGKLTAELFLESFEKGAGRIDEEFSQLPLTVERATTYLGNVWESIIDGANDTSGATGSIAQSIKDLADTVEENKDGIISLFSNLIDASAWVIGAIANIAKSFEGWAAVVDGELGFFEFATMNAEELAVWLEKDRQGIVDLEKKIEELGRKRKEVAYSYALTSEARKAKQAELKAIDAQIAAHKLQIKVIKNLSQVVEEEYHDPWIQGAKEVVKGTEKVTYTQKQLNKFVKDGEKLGEDLWLVHDKGMKKANMRGIQLVGTMEELKEKTAKVDGALSEFFDDLDDGSYQATTSMSDDWEELSSSIETNFKTMVGDSLRGEFDSIGDAFKSLIDDMLSTFLGMVAEMMASEAWKWLTSWFTGDEYSFGGFSFGGGSGGGVGDLMSWGSALKTGVSKVGGWLGITSATSTAPAAIASTTPAYVAGGAPLASAPAYSLMPYSTTGTLAGAAGATGTATSVNAGTQLALAEGTYGSSLGGGGGAAMAGAGVAAAAVFGAKMIAEWGADGSLYDQLQQAAVGIQELQAAGVGDTLTRITGDTAENLDALADDFEAFTHVSANASGVMYLARESMDGLTTSVDSSVMVLNQATGEWVDQTSAFSAMMGSMSDALAGASEVSMDVVRATAHRIAAERGLPSLEDELAAAFMVNYGAATDLNQAMKMLAAGTASSADSISSSARRVASFRNFDVRVYNPMNEGRRADGGLLPRGYATFNDGGILQGGSGIRDDLYLGTINGQAQIAMGGEYIINTYSTAKHKQLLDYINADRYAGGGHVRSTAVPLSYGSYFPGGLDLETMLLQILTHVKKAADVLRRIEHTGLPVSSRVGVSG
ncbi:tape measure protein [Desulforhopalus singaporensis]|uniref:Tape measure domain-containing protein n=1 Tax=Desulforhopalus singaporensis TaxID=91360 RepID=A0A1H0NTS6_9BACT|nr:tape measure protein [Desulforhopalus singaporensis]SDO95936.1 tape measure domain-containing protein [Desulforhopalus singaporensis]